jgi:hypothetical protein
MDLIGIYMDLFGIYMDLFGIYMDLFGIYIYIYMYVYIYGFIWNGSDTKPTTHWDTMGIELDLYRVVMGVLET